MNDLLWGGIMGLIIPILILMTVTLPFKDIKPVKRIHRLGLGIIVIYSIGFCSIFGIVGFVLTMLDYNILFPIFGIGMIAFSNLVWFVGTSLIIDLIKGRVIQ